MTANCSRSKPAARAGAAGPIREANAATGIALRQLDVRDHGDAFRADDERPPCPAPELDGLRGPSSRGGAGSDDQDASPPRLAAGRTCGRRRSVPAGDRGDLCGSFERRETGLVFPPSLSDLDALVLRCRDPKARSYLAEAVTCLKAGAFRASIVVTWVAVVHDLLSKLEQLSLGGDRNAQTKIEEFRRIVGDGDVRASLDFERTILEVARDDFELFGPLAHVDLARLRDDRHRCAHPSMIDPDTDYQPAPELARSHVVNAVTHLLEHGPAQGKAALHRLMADLEQMYFPKTIDELIVHLEHGPLGRPRASLVRNYVIVLLKTYSAEAPPAPSDLLDAIRVYTARAQTVQRIALALQAVVRMHRQVAVAALDEKVDGIVAQASDARLGAFLALAAGTKEVWYALSQAQRNRVERYVRSMPVGELQPSMRAAWAIAETRDAASERLTRLSADGWEALGRMTDPPPEWVGLALEQMARASTWGEANRMKEFLVGCVHLISEEPLKTVLAAARSNEELRTSWGVKDTLGALTRSEHFGPARVKALVEEAGLAEAYTSEAWWQKACQTSPVA
jgi:hypothetical protein